MRWKVTAALLGVMSALPCGLAAQTATPQLKQGMPYSQARKLMIAAGWQANVNNKLIADHLDKILEAWYIEHNFTEIEECSPTGFGFCVAAFHNDAGRMFYIFSTGGSRDAGAYKGTGPKVVSFCLQKRTVNCE